jgi:segregation and condensation protein B
MPDLPDQALPNPANSLLAPESWQLDVVTDDPDEVADEPGNSPPSVQRILEALLFVGGSPLTAERAMAAIRGLTASQFSETVDALNRDYRRQGRPYGIYAQGQGYSLTLRPRFKSVAERLYGHTREARLSHTAIDVLSLVAYRQPVTKQEIDGIRGVESGAIIRQLIRRSLVAIVQRAQAGSREVSYGTTPRFLELFKLSSLEDLPQTQDLQKL